MATSGSYDYSRTAAQLITIALENIGVLAAGGTVTSNDSTTCLARLNLIAKQYQGMADFARGLKLISRQRAWLFLQQGRQTYLVGPASTDARATTAHGRTTIRAAEAAGQTVLDVTALTDTTTDPGTTVTMTDADIIGIQTDDSGGDDIHWTTISSSSSSGPTVTIASALPTARPAAVGNYVWWFTSRAQRLVLVESAVLRNENRQDTELKVYRTVQEYEEGVADKYADGQPTAILVEPLRIATRITLNSQPTDVRSQIILTGLYPQEDYDATTDDIAFPQEALRFLGWELAFEVCDVFGREWLSSMEKKRVESRETYLNLNPEVSDAYFISGGV